MCAIKKASIFWGIVIIILVLIIVHTTVQTHNNGPCIPVQPQVVDGGKISSGWSVSYTLYYKGIYERSKKECIARIYVTPTEYDRRMYK